MQNQTTHVTCTWCGRKMALNPGSFSICIPCTDSVIADLPPEPRASGDANAAHDAEHGLYLPDGKSKKG